MTRLPDPAVGIRPAAHGDLAACADVWRASLDDYGQRVGRLPLTQPAPSFLEMLGHLLNTDPDLFLVAERTGGGVVAFGSAIRRGAVWFLSMLFVAPGQQARGLGRLLLERLLPDPAEGLILATCTDSAQPISNGLYSRYGMVPRIPVLELVGRPTLPAPGLPAGVRAVPFDVLTMGGPLDPAMGPGPARLGQALDALDRDLVGYARPGDHAYLVRTERRAYLYETMGGEVLGYGYAARSGRLGPVATRDSELTGPILGHLMRAVDPAGAFAAWVPGTNGEAVRCLLEAGLYLEDFPALVCWTQPFADFSRYLPITLALL